MKAIIISVMVGAALIIGVLVLTSGNNDRTGTGPIANADNVSMVDGKQIILISAKGGYQPRKSIARAGVPTILRFSTNGTFDCSSFIRIPSMNISKSLPQTGSTDIDLGSPQGSILQGMCGMGMYRFEVDFQG